MKSRFEGFVYEIVYENLTYPRKQSGIVAYLGLIAEDVGELGQNFVNMRLDFGKVTVYSVFICVNSAPIICGA